MIKEAVLDDVVFHGVGEEIQSATAILKDANGERIKAPLWYDRKFEGVGLRVGDLLSVFETREGRWSIKSLLKKSEVDTPIVFPKGMFPNVHVAPVDKVAALLVP